MELKLINDQGQSSATVSASDTLFGREYNEALIHQVVTAYQANARLVRAAHASVWARLKTTRTRRPTPTTLYGATATPGI